MCIFKQQPQKSHEQDILPKNLQIDRSFFAFYGTHAAFGDFYASGTQDADVTKSLHFLAVCICCHSVHPIPVINSTVTIVFWQSTVRPFLVDPSSRATEWLKAHLKDQRLEVINQQVLNILYFSIPVSVVVNNSILKVVNKILLIGKWKRRLCCRC